MKQKKFRLIIIFTAFTLLLFVNLYFFFVKIAGFIFLLTGIIELACFLTLLIATLILTYKIIKLSAFRNTSNYLTIGLALLVLIALKVPSLRANENTFQSPVKIKACYEGTMNTSYLYLRENGNFENFNIGWFAYVNYSQGTWKQKTDTIFFDYEGTKIKLLGEKVLIKDENLYRIEADSLYSTFYYLGECKGLN
jgi:hypothetical protein